MTLHFHLGCKKVVAPSAHYQRPLFSFLQISRLEGQVLRYKTAAENAEKVEDELKAEKRKLQREVFVFICFLGYIPKKTNSSENNSLLPKEVDPGSNLKETAVESLILLLVFDLHSDCHLLLCFGQFDNKKKDSFYFCFRSGLFLQLLYVLSVMNAQHHYLTSS